MRRGASYSFDGVSIFRPTAGPYGKGDERDADDSGWTEDELEGWA